MRGCQAEAENEVETLQRATALEVEIPTPYAPSDIAQEVASAVATSYVPRDSLSMWT